MTTKKQRKSKRQRIAEKFPDEILVVWDHDPESLSVGMGLTELDRDYPSGIVVATYKKSMVSVLEKSVPVLKPLTHGSES